VAAQTEAVCIPARYTVQSFEACWNHAGAPAGNIAPRATVSCSSPDGMSTIPAAIQEGSEWRRADAWPQSDRPLDC